MANISVVFGRTASFAVAAFLIYGNILFEVHAFQATSGLQNPLCSSLKPLPTPSGVCISRISMQNHQSRRNDPSRRRGGGLFVAVDVASTDATPANALDDEPIEHQDPPLVFSATKHIFFPISDPNIIDEEWECTNFVEEECTLAFTKRGRKRRAIQRMREKYFSRPIESRLAKTLLFPVNVLLWKPAWITMDVFIDRLDDDKDEAMVLESSRNSNISTDSSHGAETIAVSSTPHAAATITAPGAIAVEVKQEDSASSEASSSETTSHIEIQDESVDVAMSVKVKWEDSTISEKNSIETTSHIEIQDESVDVALSVEVKWDDSIEIQNEAVDVAPSEPAAIAEAVAVDETVDKEEDAALDTNNATPKGDRWAIAAPGVDLSGKWELIVTTDFKKMYDKYLDRLGQPRLVRSVALSGPVIGKTMEEVIQFDLGQSLQIRGKNVRGTWDRTLVASGTTKKSDVCEPLIVPIQTVDQEMVQSEAWWEDQGKAHVSWMRGVSMYGGGSFYSRRYLEEKEHEDDETVYACEGFFEFNDPKKENNELTWRFRRQTE